MRSPAPPNSSPLARQGAVPPVSRRPTRWTVVCSILIALLACSEPKPRYEVLGGDRHDRAEEARATAEPPEAATTREEPGAGDAEGEGDGDPEHGDERSAASRAADTSEPSPLERLGPPLGRTLVVGPEESLVEGTSYPSSQLLQGLRALTPGDRLILEPGLYEGPIRIDDSMRDGRNPEPIQVVAKTDAVLTISDKNSDATAVLQVQRSFWEFHGLEVRAPLAGVGGIEVSEVKMILLADCHIHNLGGAAVRALDRVREVRIRNSHLHQLGLGRRPTDAYGVSLADPRTGLLINQSQIHHTALGAFAIAGTVAATESELARWDNIVVRDSEVK